MQRTQAIGTTMMKMTTMVITQQQPLALLATATAMVAILGLPVAAVSVVSDPMWQHYSSLPHRQHHTNAACGQVVSGVVNLTANLNCSGDGIIVGGPNTVINMNGFSITGPGQDSSKVAIMVPNVDNVVVNGPGSLSNFQAGVLLTGANGFKISSVILSDNQIGTFMTGADNAQVQQNIIQGNSIGVASHSSTGAAIDSNLMNGNLLAGITFVNTQQSNVGMNNVVGSQNGVFLDGQSKQNTISANNVLENVIDLNNANGLPTNINTNQFTDNSCQTSNPSGLCIGR